MREESTLHLPAGDERFERVLRLARLAFGMPMAAVRVFGDGITWCQASSGLKLSQTLPVPMEQSTLSREVFNSAQPSVVHDVLAHDRFRDQHRITDTDVQFYAGFPFFDSAGHVAGLLAVMDHHPRAFGERDLRALGELAEWVGEEWDVGEQMVQAGRVQRSLLPLGGVRLGEYELAGACRPARDTGGDFYDHLVRDGALHFSLADVMGKGLSSALLAATTRAALRGAYDPADGVAELVGRAARSLTSDLDLTATFVTVFTGRIDPSAHRLDYVDSGHGLALLVQADGTWRSLPSEHVPIGIGHGTPWRAQQIPIPPGATLVAVSDGFLEPFLDVPTAMAECATRARAARSPREAVAELMRAVSRDARSDDLTAVVVRRNP